MEPGRIFLITLMIFVGLYKQVFCDLFLCKFVSRFPVFNIFLISNFIKN
jgi:hypothetical protein